MGKNEYLQPKKMITIGDILQEIKKIYSITSKSQDEAITRRLQRFMKENNIRHFQQKKHGNTHLYQEEVLEAVLNDENMRKYLTAKSNNTANYKTNKEYYRERKSEYDKIMQTFMDEWKSAGLTPDEGNLLEFDRWNEGKYLQIDELKHLEKKGLVLRSSLSDEEKEDLEEYERHILMEEEAEKKIADLFTRKKMEIMITALFNEKFTLDEKRLYTDVSNYIRGGEKSMIFLEDGEIPTGDGKIDFDINTIPYGMFDISRSYDRLMNGKSYYRKKKNK